MRTPRWTPVAGDVEGGGHGDHRLLEGRISGGRTGCGQEAYKVMPSRKMDLVQYRSDGRTICRASANMMQGNDSVRIYENISAPLVNVPFRLPQSLSLHYLLQISPPCFRPPDVPEGSGQHPVVPVCFARVIDQKRPGQGSFSHVTAGEEVVFERDHCNFHVPSGEFIFMITQLRDVRPAGQSAEVAVKHQQQPAPTVVRENMNSTTTVPKFERNGRFPRQLVHRVLSRIGGHLMLGSILRWTHQNANRLRWSQRTTVGCEIDEMAVIGSSMCITRR